MDGCAGWCSGNDEVKYVQKRAPLTPDWQSCFDAHLYRGRTFEMTVMQRPQQKVGSVTVSAQSLSEHCTGTEDIATVWVSQRSVLGPVYSDATQLDVQLSCVAINGALLRRTRRPVVLIV